MPSASERSNSRQKSRSVEQRLNDEANALLNRAEVAEKRAETLEGALRRIAEASPPPFMSADFQQYARDVLEALGA